MKKLLLAAVAAASFASVMPAAQAQDAICNEQGCAGVPRCYYMTDYPTCLWPWPIIPRS